MNQGLSNSLPILAVLQTFGLLIALAPFFALSGARPASSTGALAIGGAALVAYSPFLHGVAILTLGSGLPTPYAGFACYLAGIACFVAGVFLTRRWRTALALAGLGVSAAWTFFILLTMASGF